MLLKVHGFSDKAWSRDRQGYRDENLMGVD
jgi:hypothetical protein